MNGDSLKCSLCGKTMKRVKVLPKQLVRFRCTRGHCEDLEHHKPSFGDNAHERPVIEGFRELP